MDGITLEKLAEKHDSCGLTPREIAGAFADPIWAEKYPPILDVDQAAELLRLPKSTIYDWSSRDLLKTCAARAGKHLRFFRDRLVAMIFNNPK
jgi:hypothetical protein